MFTTTLRVYLQHKAALGYEYQDVRRFHFLLKLRLFPQELQFTQEPMSNIFSIVRSDAVRLSRTTLAKIPSLGGGGSALRFINFVDFANIFRAVDEFRVGVTIVFVFLLAVFAGEE